MAPKFCTDPKTKCQGSLKHDREVAKAKQSFEESVRTNSCRSSGACCPLSKHQRRIYYNEQEHGKVHDSNNRKNYSEGFVRAIQCRLGTPTRGIFTPDDTRAIMAVECKIGLEPSGKISPKILQHLKLHEENKNDSYEEIYDEKVAATFEFECENIYDEIFIKTPSGEIRPNPKYELSYAMLKRKDVQKAFEELLGIKYQIDGEKTFGGNEDIKCSSQCESFLNKLETVFVQKKEMCDIKADKPVIEEAVGYTIKCLQALEKDKRKGETLRQIKDAETAKQLDTEWLSEREKVSTRLLALSAFLKDPSYAALSFQGTHYAGLQETVADVETGIYMQLQMAMASLVHSKAVADDYIRTGKMSRLYYTGVVCNEMAFASAKAGEFSKAPVSIAKDNWKKQFENEHVGFEEYYRRGFDGIEQGDLVVTLEDDSVEKKERRQPEEQKSKKKKSRLEYDIIRDQNPDHLLNLKGKHVNVVVAVRMQDGKKEVLLAGATGTDNPNGVLCDKNGNPSWKNEQTVVGDNKNYVIVKSKREQADIKIDNSIFDNLYKENNPRYQVNKKKIEYNIEKGYCDKKNKTEGYVYLLGNLTDAGLAEDFYTFSELNKKIDSLIQNKTIQFITKNEYETLKSFFKGKIKLSDDEQEVLLSIIKNNSSVNLKQNKKIKEALAFYDKIDKSLQHRIEKYYDDVQDEAEIDKIIRWISVCHNSNNLSSSMYRQTPQWY